MFKTVATIIASELRPSGLVFTFRTKDESQRELKLGLAINSTMPKAREIANARFAELCRSTGLLQVTDTNQLHGIEVIVEYRANGELVGCKPVKVVEYVNVPRQTFWEWLLRR